MPIETKKPLMKCSHCSKEVANLANHYINNHPSIVAQIEEGAVPTINKLDNSISTPAPPSPIIRPQTDINTLVREKLDLMLNIKIIEMLSKNSSVSIQELNSAINPAPAVGVTEKLQEYKLMHDLFNKDKKEEKEIDIPETGNQWIDLATSAIPLVRDLMSKRGGNENVEYRRIEEPNTDGNKQVSQNIRNDTSESISVSGQPTKDTPSNGEPTKGIAIINSRND